MVIRVYEFKCSIAVEYVIEGFVFILYTIPLFYNLSIFFYPAFI